jgi:hypothetical protein
MLAAISRIRAEKYKGLLFDYAIAVGIYCVCAVFMVIVYFGLPYLLLTIVVPWVSLVWVSKFYTGWLVIAAVAIFIVGIYQKRWELSIFKHKIAFALILSMVLNIGFYAALSWWPYVKAQETNSPLASYALNRAVAHVCARAEYNPTSDPDATYQETRSWSAYSNLCERLKDKAFEEDERRNCSKRRSPSSKVSCLHDMRAFSFEMKNLIAKKRTTGRPIGRDYEAPLL